MEAGCEVKDAERFAALYADHHQAVSTYLRNHVAEPEDAADLTMVTFERAMRAYGRYEDRGHARSWLLTIAQRALIDWCRRQSSKTVLPGGLPSDADQAVPFDDDALDVREALACLTDIQRRVLMARARGYSLSEYARLVGRAPHTIHTHSMHAARALRRELAR